MSQLSLAGQTSTSLMYVDDHLRHSGALAPALSWAAGKEVAGWHLND